MSFNFFRSYHFNLFLFNFQNAWLKFLQLRLYSVTSSTSRFFAIGFVRPKYFETKTFTWKRGKESSSFASGLEKVTEQLLSLSPNFFHVRSFSSVWIDRQRRYSTPDESDKNRDIRMEKPTNRIVGFYRARDNGKEARAEGCKSRLDTFTRARPKSALLGASYELPSHLTVPCIYFSTWSRTSNCAH